MIKFWGRCGGAVVIALCAVALATLAGLATLGMDSLKTMSPSPSAPAKPTCCGGGCRCGETCPCDPPRALSLVKDAAGNVYVIDPSICGPGHKRRLTPEEFTKEWGVVAPATTKK